VEKAENGGGRKRMGKRRYEGEGAGKGWGLPPKVNVK